MDNQLMDTQLMDLEQALENQLIIVKEMRGMKNEVNNIRVEIKRDVQELRDSITLSRSECSELQAIVGKRAWHMTHSFFDKKVSDDLFLAKVGHFRSIIYKRLKDTFNVPRYYDIRRIDFRNAQNLIDMVDLSNLKDYQLRLTTRQREIAEANGDDVSTFSKEEENGSCKTKNKQSKTVSY